MAENTHPAPPDNSLPRFLAGVFDYYTLVYVGFWLVGLLAYTVGPQDATSQWIVLLLGLYLVIQYYNAPVHPQRITLGERIVGYVRVRNVKQRTNPFGKIRAPLYVLHLLTFMAGSVGFVGLGAGYRFTTWLDFLEFTGCIFCIILGQWLWHSPWRLFSLITQVGLLLASRRLTPQSGLAGWVAEILIMAIIVAWVVVYFYYREPRSEPDNSL